jgi:hypothetical protein
VSYGHIDNRHDGSGFGDGGNRLLAAYLTAWSLFVLQRIIIWEIPFLGPKVVAVGFTVSFFFPFLAGWLCEIAWNKFHS